MTDIDDVIEYGYESFRISWDSGSPGAGAGTELVIRYGDDYYVFLSDDDDHGPYKDLSSALDDKELSFIREAVTSVESFELDTPELIDLLRASSAGQSIKINGVVHTSNDRMVFVKQ